MPIGRETKSVLLLTLAGLVSGLVTTAVPAVIGFLPFGPLRPALSAWLGGGFFFGATVAAYFALYEHVRSMPRLVVYTAVCWLAFVLSIQAGCATLVIAPMDNSRGWESTEMPVSMFFGAGLAGAFVVLGAAVLLFRSASMRWRTWAMLLFGSMAGGLLGVLGAPTAPSGLALFVVWQTGMGLVLGLIMAVEGAPSSGTAAAALPSFAEVTRGALRTLGMLVGAGICGLVVWQAARSVQAFTVEWRVKRAIAEAPPAQNLPPIQPRPIAEALILEDVGGLLVSAPTTNVVRAEPKYVVPVPPSSESCVFYDRTRKKLFGSEPPTAEACVVQYPNAAWARYEAKYYLSPFLVDGKFPTAVAFGNTVIVDARQRDAEGGGSLRYVWPSGDTVVSITQQTSHNQEILRRYLERYPSGL